MRWMLILSLLAGAGAAISQGKDMPLERPRRIALKQLEVDSSGGKKFIDIAPFSENENRLRFLRF